MEYYNGKYLEKRRIKLKKIKMNILNSDNLQILVKKTPILYNHENIVFILIYDFSKRFNREFEGMCEVFTVFKNNFFSIKTGVCI